MHSWEQSAKLKVAEELKKYYASQGLAIPDEHTPFLDFIRDNKTFIEHARLQLWPNLKGKHPSNRWTGAPGLLEDAQLADQYWGSAIKDEIGTTLTEFYQTEYRKINLNVHGSALAGIRGIRPEGFHIICALTFKSCTHFAVLYTKIILNDYNFAAHYPELNSKWEELKQQRELAYANARGWLRVPNEDSN